MGRKLVEAGSAEATLDEAQETAPQQTEGEQAGAETSTDGDPDGDPDGEAAGDDDVPAPLNLKPLETDPTATRRVKLVSFLKVRIGGKDVELAPGTVLGSDHRLDDATVTRLLREQMAVIEYV